MKRWPIVLAGLLVAGLAGAWLFSSGLQGQSSPPPVFPKELTSYRDVVKAVLPAVVSIRSMPKATTTTTREKSAQPRRRPRMQDLPGIPEEFRKFFEGMEEGPNFEFDPEDVVPQQSFGSGFIIDPKGVVLTNYHVVDGADRVEVTLKDGRKFISKEIKGDRKNDLAIVRISAGSPLPYLQLGDSDAMEIGDRVLAVGAPFGLTGSVTAGIVSAKGRDGLSPGHAVYEDYLQTDAAINPGNSGGPLVNLEGRVIGINTAIRTRSGGFQGVGLAITSNVAKNIVDQLVHGGVVHRGYLGIGFQPLTSELAEQLGLNEQHGVVVRSVVKDSPAGKAGLKPLDVIVAINGKHFEEGRELQRLVNNTPVNQSIDLTVVRDGKTRTIPVTIEEQPQDYGVSTLQRRGNKAAPQDEEESQDVTVEKFGFDVAELTEDSARSFGYRPNTEGVVVTNVQPNSVAAEAGLTRGMLITKVNKKSVAAAKDVRRLVEKTSSSKGVLLEIQYPQRLGGGSGYIVLKPEPVEK
jgi:serine protease Do